MENVGIIFIIWYNLKHITAIWSIFYGRLEIFSPILVQLYHEISGNPDLQVPAQDIFFREVNISLHSALKF
jgi:hypothetical protein